MKEEYVSIKQTAARVRDISLIDVTDMTGNVRDKYEKSKRHTAKGPVSVTGQKFMNWKLHEGGFGAIDLIIHLEKLDFKSAVIRLADRFPYCSIRD